MPRAPSRVRNRRATKVDRTPTRRSASPELSRLRRIALAHAEATEVAAWGAPTFRVRNKIFATYEHDHHGSKRTAVWCKASWVNQEALLRARPQEVFRPPYVGPRGWIGIHLTGGVDWAFVADAITDAYRLTAPKRLLTVLDEASDPAHAAPAAVRRGADKPSSRRRR